MTSRECLPIPLSLFGQSAVTENNPAYFLYQSIIDDVAVRRQRANYQPQTFRDTDSITAGSRGKKAAKGS